MNADFFKKFAPARVNPRREMLLALMAVIAFSYVAGH